MYNEKKEVPDRDFNHTNVKDNINTIFYCSAKQIKSQDRLIAQVFESSDYSKFTTLIGNRDPDHVEKIAHSIKEVGRLMIPIIVNENFQIIDGGNRIMACERVDVPVAYIICPGYGIKECIALNNNAKNWKPENYIKCYADNGYEDYKVLREIEKEYSPQLPKQLIRSTCAGYLNNTKMQDIIAKGIFKMAHNANDIRALFDYLLQFNFRKTGQGKTEYIQKVLRFCYEWEAVDNKRMLEQFKKYVHTLNPPINIQTAAEEVERIYNFHRSKNSYVYIANEYKRKACESAIGLIPGGGKIDWYKEPYKGGSNEG